MHKTVSTMTDTLVPIWERVLRLPSIGVDDNFFDLGGDSVLALELFNEISNVCGRELPPVMIYQAPTIAALAPLLEQPMAPRVPPIVLLRPGTQEPSVFITHGLGGSVMDFYQVVKHIRTPRAIYGMQAKGIDGVEPPLDRIEDMAQYSLKAVRKQQPRGPYFLIGYSLGGLVTLEMARQLSADGEKIALLAMLDSYPHMRYLSLGQRARLAVQQTRRASGRLKWRAALSTPYKPASDVPLSSTMRRFRDSAYLALERYQPRFYAGKVNFVRAAIAKDFPADPAAVWAHLAEKFVVDTVPGDHLEIMTTHYGELAAVLSRYLSEALCS
jgi:acetoacetyl-CoA synthetase